MFRLITRIAIVLILALSIGALVMAVILFQQRETLKGRTQKLEEAVHKIAATIEVGGASNAAMLAISDDQLKTYKAKAGGTPAMDQPLSQVIAASKNQLTRLHKVQNDLADNKTELAKTEEELKSSKSELAAVQTKISEQEAVIESKNAAIRAKEAATRNFDNEKNELMARIETIKSDFEEMAVENNELADQNDTLEFQVADLESRVFKKDIPKGQQGIVAYVSPDWNFLIVRLAPQSLRTTRPNLELMVYRADKLVGKVRVASIIDNLAVAEIISDWQQMAPQNGDGILY
jgi:septal ring factor EnvC (AmiA/AmiB activator)